MKKLEVEILESQLSEESYQAAIYVAGYVSKKLTERSKCDTCVLMLQASAKDLTNATYLDNMSRGNLTTPSSNLVQHVANAFYTLDLVDCLIIKSQVPARIAAEHILQIFSDNSDFVCVSHLEWDEKYSNRIVTNIFYNNMQKESKDRKRKDDLERFKGLSPNFTS